MRTAIAVTCLLLAAPARAGEVALIAHTPSHAAETLNSLFHKLSSSAELDDGDFISAFWNGGGGRLSPARLRSFQRFLTFSYGKLDRAPIRVVGLRVIDDDPYFPVYAVGTVRSRWFPAQRMEANGLVPELPVGFRDEKDAWLVAFRGDNVDGLREAPELLSYATEQHGG